MDDAIERAFMLGIRVAEHVYGVAQNADVARDASNKILATLEQIDAGELTLIDTPEETEAKAPPGMPESLKQRLPAILNESRRAEVEMVKLILRSMFGEG